MEKNNQNFNFSADFQSDNDFELEGIMHCGRCGEAKEYPVVLGTTSITVPVMCRCERSEAERREKERAAFEFKLWKENMLKTGLRKPEFKNYTFANDDLLNKDVSNICQSYAENFNEALERNLGLLFYGGTGSGKTFLAIAIANALIDMKKSVYVTSVTEWIDMAQRYDAGNKQAILDKIMRVSLLVIDDLGAERNTSFGLEQAYLLINSRYEAGLPTIATTNKSLEELKSPEFLEFQRIYDRVLEMCTLQVKVPGKSRREAIRKAKQKEAIKAFYKDA